jgi:hypothetical protein
MSDKELDGGEAAAMYALELRKAQERIAELEAVLTEIAKGEGAFSRDRLTHAENCVDNMKDLARNALAQGQDGGGNAV